MVLKPGPLLHERVLLVCLIVVALVFFPTFGNPFAAKQPLGAVGLWLAIGLLLLSTRQLRWAGLFPALAAVGALAIAAAGAQNRGAAALGFAVMAAGPLLFAALGARGASRPFRRGLPMALALAGAVMAALGLAQAASLEGTNFGLQALGKMKVFATLGNPNWVACFLLAAIPAGLAVLSRARGRWRRAAMGAVVVAMVLCLASTQARSAYLAVCFGLAAWLATRRRAATPWRVLAVGGVAVAAALALGLSAHSGRGRLLIWREAVQIARSAPWTGVGPGNFNVHQLGAQRAVLSDPRWAPYAQNAALVFDAHNEPLHWMVEGGPVAAAGLLSCAFIALRRGARRARRSTSYRLQYAGLAAQMGFCLWNSALSTAALSLAFWSTAALLAGRARFFPRPATHRWLPAAGPLLASVAAAVAAPALLRASALEGEAALLLEAGPFCRATELLTDATRLNPFDGYLREKRALALYFDQRPDDALAELARARALFGDIGIDYLEAEIRARKGQHAAAALLFEEISRAYPAHVTPHFMLGQLYLRLGHYSAAERSLARVVSMPDSPHNLKLDRSKIARQKQVALELLEHTPQLQGFREGL